MLKIRRSRDRDRLIFNMGIPIPGKDGLYIETGPWQQYTIYTAYDAGDIQQQKMKQTWNQGAVSI